jgi:hypothetical protein
MRWALVGLLLVAGSGFLLYVAEEMRQASKFRLASPSASSKAGGIHKALMLYAQDHEGRFPTGTQGATHAFRELFPDGYLADEKLFYVPGSAWHDEARKKRPDNVIGTKPDFAQALERGENHWAYVSGLTTESAPTLPLIADGFVEGEPGRYTDDPAKKGGVWKGMKAVVVYVSGSAKAERLSAKPDFRVMRTVTDQHGGTPQVDIFSRDGGLPENARVLNPW